MNSKSNELAELVNSTNYATMSYDELVTLSFAFHLATMTIKPLMDKKREDEMDAHTDAYVEKMNTYGASKAEVLARLEKRAMRETPYGPMPTQDVEDQNSTVAEEDYLDMDKPVLLLPAPATSTTSEVEETVTVEESTDEALNNEDILNCGKESDSSCEEDKAIQDDSVSDDISTEVNTTPKPILVEAAIEIAKRGHIPDDIDVNAPYFIDYTICHDGNGKLWREDKYGRNLDVKDLEAFRGANEKHQRLFRKKEVMLSNDDCLVFREDADSIRVYFYHFPENETAGDETQKPGTVSYSNAIPYYATVDLHKTHRRMRRAIEKAKEYSASFGSSSSPYYDRYTFYDNNVSTELQSNERVVVDEDTLVEIKSAFETFTRLYNAGTVVISEDNCVVVKANKGVYLVLFNFPSQAKVSAPAKRKRRKVVKEAEPLHTEQEMASDSDDAVETPATGGTETVKDVTQATGKKTLVERAVEFVLKRRETQDAPEGKYVNTPYYEDYTVTAYSDGRMETRMPAKIKMDIKSLESFKVASERFFRLYYKDKDMISTADYVAYTCKENVIVVRFYHFPSDPTADSETVTDDQTSDVDKDTMKKLRAKMRNVMRKAKNDSKKKEDDVDNAFYDRYEYYLDCECRLHECSNYSRRYDDTATVVELKAAFEDYVKAFITDPMVIATKDIVAVMENAHKVNRYKRIYIIYFNVPEQKSNNIQDEQKPATETMQVTEGSSMATNQLSTSDEDPLIAKTVEMTQALPLCDGTDANAPYFKQCDWTITGDGGLIAGKTFSRNIDTPEKLRAIHQKCAKSFKASIVSFTDNYTAYIWNQGKNLSVFYYNTKSTSTSAD